MLDPTDRLLKRVEDDALAIAMVGEAIATAISASRCVGADQPTAGYARHTRIVETDDRAEDANVLAHVDPTNRVAGLT